MATALFALVLLELVAGAAFGILHAMDTDGGGGPLDEIPFLLTAVLFPVVGFVLASRRPDNALGWLMLAIGIVACEPVSAYGEYALAAGLPGAAWALAGTSWTWVPVIGLSGTFVLLLFPDGHLPSPGWRWFAWTIGIGMVLASLAILLSPGTLADLGHPEIENPYGIESLRSFLAIGFAAIATIPIGIIGAAVSLFRRYWRSGPTERLQIRWVATAAAIVAVAYAIAMIASVTSAAAGWATDGGWLAVLQSIAILLFALIPISIGVAVLRYRLYDIDLVIRKAVVVGALVGFFTVVYAGVVGGVGALVQTRRTPVLSFVAAAVVALLFQPVLRRSRRLADRIVYGRRATPYEVLSEFSERVGGTYPSEDVLPRMARIAAEGVGARRAVVWIERDGRLRVAASWPQDDDLPEPVHPDDEPLALPGADHTFPVEYDGALLGALAVAMPPADPMDEAKAKLVADLAAQAGLVLRNARLTDELRARLEDLKAAQKRLVAAQDAERRRLERNIHDGAQQQLVALSVRLRLAQSMLERDPSAALAILDELQVHTTATLEDLRDLARGIYPPLLADKGLTAALDVRSASPPSRWPSHPTESAATSRRWRRRRTSASSRRCRTWPSTRARRAWTSCSGNETAISSSRSGTTGRVSIRIARLAGAACRGWRTGSPRSRERSTSAARRVRAQPCSAGSRSRLRLADGEAIPGPPARALDRRRRDGRDGLRAREGRDALDPQGDHATEGRRRAADRHVQGRGGRGSARRLTRAQDLRRRMS
ncbi:MAG TPA: histidine kinase [Actinomycetota bacterium]|nr:histidine kinase [Actinomycetota bacterium]